jgi:hypothetical protein
MSAHVLLDNLHRRNIGFMLILEYVLSKISLPIYPILVLHCTIDMEYNELMLKISLSYLMDNVHYQVLIYYYFLLRISSVPLNTAECTEAIRCPEPII